MKQQSRTGSVYAKRSWLPGAISRMVLLPSLHKLMPSRKSGEGSTAPCWSCCLVKQGPPSLSCTDACTCAPHISLAPLSRPSQMGLDHSG